jgi:CDP-diacylglycerol--serine O-phosphatidyltransferase
MIVAGAVFDFFDGMVARALGISSPIGKELDSLADVVTFGVAPSAMIFQLFGMVHYPEWLASAAPYLPYTAFIMAAFSALRLAKFNLDSRQSTSFIGLPTPANALFWGSLIVGLHDSTALADSSLFTFHSSLPYLILAGMFISSYLLIAEIPMFALKFKHWGWKGNEIKYIFILSCVPILLLLGLFGLAVIIAWYVILSVATNKTTTKPE